MKPEENNNYLNSQVSFDKNNDKNILNNDSIDVDNIDTGYVNLTCFPFTYIYPNLNCYNLKIEESITEISDFKHDNPFKSYHLKELLIFSLDNENFYNDRNNRKRYCTLDSNTFYCINNYLKPDNDDSNLTNEAYRDNEMSLSGYYLNLIILANEYIIQNPKQEENLNNQNDLDKLDTSDCSIKEDKNLNKKRKRYFKHIERETLINFVLKYV